MLSLAWHLRAFARFPLTLPRTLSVAGRLSLTQVDRGHFLGDILIDVRNAECEQGGSPRPMEELRQNEEVDGPGVFLGHCV